MYRLPCGAEDVSAVRLLQQEKVHLLELNRRYLSALSQCEGRLIDLRGLLRLKDTEIEVLRSLLGDTAVADKHTLAQRVHAENLLLTEENRRLKEIAALTADINQLLSDGKSERAGEVEQLREQLKDTAETLAKVTRERDVLKLELIPRMERTAKLIELERNELERRLDNIRARGVDKDTSVADIPPPLASDDKPVISLECSSADHSPRKPLFPQKNAYVPSFQRGRTHKRPIRLLHTGKGLIANKSLSKL